MRPNAICGFAVVHQLAVETERHDTGPDCHPPDQMPRPPSAAVAASSACPSGIDAVLSRQFGRASAPMVPHRAHTIRGLNVGTGTSSGRGGSIFATLSG